MQDGPHIALIGALVGDPARANMLTSLMGGQALTAGELAREAGVTPQTASGHLSRLTAGGLLQVEAQGRHRYFRLAGPDVAAAVEALMDVATHAGQRRTRPGPKDPEMRIARVCYDHLAGERGVHLFARLTSNGLIALDPSGVVVTPVGARKFADFGVDMAALSQSKRPVCRTCLDWSERRPHLAGALGASLLARIFELGWAARVDGSRAVRFTRQGAAKFERVFVGG
jgi:DNA-binding transcriptional ArsR family regulator